MPNLPDDDFPNADKRLLDLATGFALNELAEEELAELYTRLRDPGEAGERAARLTWESIGTAIDLRATVGKQFQDTVRFQIEQETAPPDGFLKSVAAKLGFHKKSLTEVNIPSRLPVPSLPFISLSRKSFALVFFALFCGGVLFWWLGRSRELRVTALCGQATINGEPLTHESSLRMIGKTIAVTDGSHIQIRWRSGNEITLTGPGILVPNENGLSLSSGLLGIRSAERFVVGLPDGIARATATATWAVEIKGEKSIIGCRNGTVVFGTSASAASRILTPNMASTTAGIMYPWIHTRLTTTSQIRRYSFPVNAAASAWRLRLTVQFQQAADRVVLRPFPLTSPTTERSSAATAYLVLRPGLIEVHYLDGRLVRFPVPGAPLLPHTFTIEGIPENASRLRIHAPATIIPLPFVSPIQSLERQGSAILSEMDIQTGPRKIARNLPGK